MEALQNIRNERILFSPLNWGWGHVSRSIPLLKRLSDQGNEILIACDEKQREIYNDYLPNIKTIPWEAYPFHFRGNGNFGFDLLFSMRKLRRFGKKEKKKIEKVVLEQRISLVIGDHRYFFRSDSVPSIFVTHQLNLPLPWYMKLGQRLHDNYIAQFSQIWIVDDEKNSYAGNLSRPKVALTSKCKFIGPLSRFQGKEISIDKKWTTILVSGPEPYAKQFYVQQKQKFGELKELQCIIYNGRIEDLSGQRGISWREIDERLLETKKLLARSGYSTIMDVAFLKCEVELYPTPGQWEQEYLAQKKVSPK